MLAALFEKPVQMIGLLKPLYEGIAQDQWEDPTVLHGVVLHVADALAGSGLLVGNVVASPIRGTSGTVEFLVRIMCSADSPVAQPWRQNITRFFEDMGETR